MTTNELTVEKCIAADRPAHPPVHPEEILNNPEPASTLGHPPQTRLLLGGFNPEEITADFLVGIHDLADEQGLSLESISVGQTDSDGW